MSTLGAAWKVIHQNGRSSRSLETRREIEAFANVAVAKLTKMQRQLNRGSFSFAPAIGVPVPKKDGKSIRPLVLAPVESRIVQRSIHDVLLRVPAIARLAETPFSFGGVRKRNGKDIAAVPAAIEAVLGAIGEGATYFIKSDITSFFTRISKPKVTAIIDAATHEPEFLEIFKEATAVELQNLAALREHASAFPIADIGVAQGCSLSPLLGNLILSEFDTRLNAGPCRCLRYIDDFIILAPSRAAGRKCFSEAKKLLKDLGMETSKDKTLKGLVSEGFEFLGIELSNGAIRPTKQSRNRLLSNLNEVVNESIVEFRAFRKSGKILRSLSVIRTLYEFSAIVYGWGRHYRFCNEKNAFRQIDANIDNLLRRYLGAYSAERRLVSPTSQRLLLGIPLLENLVSNPFDWSSSVPDSSRSIEVPAIIAEHPASYAAI
jgi:retron-type reverse transcriptase